MTNLLRPSREENDSPEVYREGQSWLDTYEKRKKNKTIHTVQTKLTTLTLLSYTLLYSFASLEKLGEQAFSLCWWRFGVFLKVNKTLQRPHYL